MRAVLSRDELQRAARLRSRKHRDQFVVSRAFMRQVLGSYLRISPRDVRFRYGQAGKPAVASADHDLRFNLSHSRTLVFMAVTKDREVGVDIEFIDHSLDWEPIARSFLPPRERAALRSTPPEARRAAFFCWWTRNEALVKARGDRLSTSMQGASPQTTANGWRYLDIAAPPGYAAALVVECPHDAPA
jgi:4'-phosphopantetheinyl transferase